ncbi:hypothetical protein ABU614_13695 [Lysobacter firmicutimachus]|uniref:Lipoprotein n=1 Tax=Lysobacter firmicutimachus TaxID=1792846 RepID=A0AAU8MMQ5_9GAMM
MKVAYGLVLMLVVFSGSCATAGKAGASQFEVESAELLLDGGSIVISISDESGRHRAKLDRSLDALDRSGGPLLFVDERELSFSSEEAMRLKGRLDAWAALTNCSETGLASDVDSKKTPSTQETKCLSVMSFIRFLEMRRQRGADH